jgi:hypothetical protein
MTGHKFDCAVHNLPAGPAAPCDCGYAATRADALEEAAMIAEAWESPLNTVTTTRLLGRKEASRSIAAKIRKAKGEGR